jgi:hypothetical protein
VSPHDEERFSTSSTTVCNEVTGGGCTLPILPYAATVMHGESNGVVPVYLIWYGYNGATPASKAALETYVQNVSANSTYFNVLATYYDSTGPAATSISLAGSGPPTGSGCPTGANPNLWSVVQCSGFPLDANSIYMVVVAPGYAESDYCNTWCGWHSEAFSGSGYIKYGFLGDAQGCSGCSFRSQTSHGGATDGMINVLSHEIAETISDPNLNGWRIPNCPENEGEIGDVCSWEPCNVQVSSAGNLYDLSLGSGDQNAYLVQALWENVGDGQCTMSSGACIPKCNSKVCGADGCGGTCGSCSGALVCEESIYSRLNSSCVACGNGTNDCVSPQTATTDTGGTVTLTVSGGSDAGYAWSVQTNDSGGTLGSNCSTGSRTCTWTAGPKGNTIDTLYVEDNKQSPTNIFVSTITVDPALVVTPATTATDIGGSVQLKASGGAGSGYSWSQGTNRSGGTLSNCPSGSTTCTWTAGATSGVSDVINLLDPNGITVKATVTVDPALVVTPATTAVATTSAVMLAASGGAGSGYTWSVGTNTSQGTLGANCVAGGANCTWTTGSIPGGDDAVRLTDANGVSVSATITVGPQLVVTPASSAADTMQAVQLTASGGSGSGYKWSIASSGSGGSLGNNCVTGSATCTWNTGVTPSTTDRIQLMDSNGLSAIATVTINPLLVISPASRTTDAGNDVTFTASGGSGSGYSWTVVTSGSGGVLGANCTGGSSSCTWIAGSLAGTDTVQLSDGTGKTVVATVTVNPALLIAPATKTTDAGAAVTLTVSGGSGAGYSWSAQGNSSGGTKAANCASGSTSCTWNVGSVSGGVDAIQVTDSNGITVVAQLTVMPALVVTPGNIGTEGGSVVNLTASGGSSSGYSWAVRTSGSHGTLGSNCVAGSSACSWTTGSLTGTTDNVQLTDSNGVIVVTTITVNPPLAIIPAGPTATPGQLISFSARYGAGSGYVWSFASGGSNSGGTISSAGSYQAGARSNVMDTVAVQDSGGFRATTTVVVESPIVIMPLAAAAEPGLQIEFQATGGSGGGFAWSFPAGGNQSGGTMTPGGAYTAGNTTGVADSILVTDAAGGTAQTTVTVYPTLTVLPASPTTTTGGSIAFSFAGGSGSGDTFSFQPGGNLSGGSLTTAGAYQAGGTSGVLDRIQVRDSVGLVGTTTVTVDPPIGITPANPTTVSGGLISFLASGGSGMGYTWTFATGGNRSSGTLSPAGAYVAGTTTGVTDTIQVRDSAGNGATTSVVVDPKIVITPATPVVLAGTSEQFNATGGSGGGYTWSFAPSGDNSGGQIAPAGLYTAGATSGVSDIVKVTDGVGNSTTTNVTVHPPLVITPNGPVELAGQHVQFSAVGGSGNGYTWAYAAGGNKSGGSLSSGGAYAAGATTGVIDTIQVSDSSLSIATAMIVVDPVLTLSPLATTVAVQDTVLFTSAGGAGGNTWTISPNNSGASFTGSCRGLGLCTYRAGATGGAADTVTVTDQVGNSVSAVITVNPALVLHPVSATVAVSDTMTFTATGGVGPFRWSIAPNKSGSSFTSTCAGATCAYQSGTTGGVVDTVVITDSLGNTASADVTVNPALAIVPSQATIAVLDAIALSAIGGVQPFNWSISTNASGGAFTGSCSNVTSCTYTAGSNFGTDTVTVTDALGNTSTIVITVNQALGLSPPIPTVAAGDMIQFFADGGVPPLSWTISVNGSGAALLGSCDGTYACLYVAGPVGNTMDTVRITDARNNTWFSVVTVNPRLAVTPSIKAVTKQGTVQLTASGGVGRFTWSLSSNNSNGALGSCDGLTTCTYTAGTIINQADTVTVSDLLGHVATSVISVVATVPAVFLNPTATTVTSGDNVPFAATGGVAPFSWAVSTNNSGAPDLSACAGQSTCSYVAGPTGNTSDVVTVTDSLGTTASATVTVDPVLTVNPPVTETEVKNEVILMAAGGVPPLSWSISTNMSGASFLSSCAGLTNCTYTAGPTPGTDTVQVSDQLGNTTTTIVTVVERMSVSPASPVLLAPMQTVPFSVSGGQAPFQWTLTQDSSGGSLSGSTFTAGPTGNSQATVSVSDALNESATINIVIGPGIALTPSSTTALAGGRVSFTAQGGSGAPYRWSFPLGGNGSGGTVDGSSGSYVAGARAPTMDTVQCQDQVGNVATAHVLVEPALVIMPSGETVLPETGVQFTATGGSGSGYSWAITTGNAVTGSTINQQGAYVAGGTPGTDTIAVTDSQGDVATILITIVAPLEVLPTSPVAVPPRGMVTFTSSGGLAPIEWTLSVNGSQGTLVGSLYTAGSLPNSQDEVVASDALQENVITIINVGPGVTVTPSAETAMAGSTLSAFAATGGNGPPYTWAFVPNANRSGGRIDSQTGAYTAGATANVTDEVVAIDTLQNMGVVTIQVIPAAQMADAGVTGFDAGTDGGVTGDAGAVFDAGEQVIDAGDATDHDAGMATDDAGVGTDAGVMFDADAGHEQGGVDAGSRSRLHAGCGCESGSAGGLELAQLAWLTLIVLMHRRRRGLRSG